MTSVAPWSSTNRVSFARALPSIFPSLCLFLPFVVSPFLFPLSLSLSLSLWSLRLTH